VPVADLQPSMMLAIGSAMPPFKPAPRGVGRNLAVIEAVDAGADLRDPSARWRAGRHRRCAGTGAATALSSQCQAPAGARWQGAAGAREDPGHRGMVARSCSGGESRAERLDTIRAGTTISGQQRRAQQPPMTTVPSSAAMIDPRSGPRQRTSARMVAMAVIRIGRYARVAAAHDRLRSGTPSERSRSTRSRSTIAFGHDAMTQYPMRRADAIGRPGNQQRGNARWWPRS